ncbi:MAG: 50S ribosomal protein L19 [Ardenticatenales bacterium]|nr:50S ribosomal protein L19 [Ardenticatenales bacterium]
MANLVQMLEAEQKEKFGQNLPQIDPGDTVRVHVRIVEGKRERVQIFEGLVLGISGSGSNRSITVRRMGAHGVGVERVFPLYSPRVDKFEVMRKAKVRRAKLYYMRERTGKRARLKERLRR